MLPAAKRPSCAVVQLSGERDDCLRPNRPVRLAPRHRGPRPPASSRARAATSSTPRSSTTRPRSSSSPVHRSGPRPVCRSTRSAGALPPWPRRSARHQGHRRGVKPASHGRFRPRRWRKVSLGRLATRRSGSTPKHFVCNDSELVEGRYVGDHAGRYEIPQPLALRPDLMEMARFDKPRRIHSDASPRTPMRVRARPRPARMH